jgi:heterodisulfide reductase subunit C
MNFDILLGLSVIVFLIGLCMRVFFWFSQGIDPTGEKIPLPVRIGKAIKGLFGIVFSAKILRILQSVFADILFQKRILNKSTYRWVMHGLIFFSFILLFFLHAVGGFTYNLLGSQYVSTLNPDMALRNVLGLLALIGVGLAVYRRIQLRSQRLKTSLSDWTALIFVALIMFSGFLLEGAKISSYGTYESMVEEYGEYDGEEALALEAYWVAENGLHSPNFSGAIDKELVESGRELNQDGSCIECHAGTQSAFVGFSLSQLIGPLAAALGDQAVVAFFRFLHITACLAFLAWLPFSKMFHIISAPFSLAINRVMGKSSDDPVNVLNRQMIGLSACTHCGACTVECSSMMFFESFQNEFILPSEKVQFLKKIAAGKKVDRKTLKRLQEGLYICTSCDRCTDICPSGINLRDLFVSSRYSLLEKGMVETSMLSHFSFPLALAQKYVGNHLKALKAVHELFRSRFKSLPSLLGPVTISKNRPMDNESYRSCYSCQRCTNICPVVRNYDNPAEALDMMPHQIIYSLGIGNIEMALGSQMIWSCSTCYLCQEHCPNKVELTDIFYRLKNIAINKIESGDK